MKPIIVLSLFDGMSGGQIALERLGIPVKTYYASEIDKYAMAVTQYHYPDTIQLGDIQNWKEWDLPKIDLVLAGSPCQGFSNAGKGLNFEDPRSKLFFTFVDILKDIQSKNPEVKFLLENVKMKQEWQDVISRYMGVEPIKINSSLVSAQNRFRLYWTNVPFRRKITDKCITWGDIREFNVADNFYYSDKALAWIDRHEKRKNKKLRIWKNEDKCQMIEASHHKKYSSQRFFGIEDAKGLRYITPLECERAQTVDDNWTLIPYGKKTMSNTQRYKMLGNGFTIEVFVHILSCIM